MMKSMRAITALCVVCVLITGCKLLEPHSTVLANAVSKDGVPIAYSVYGQGETTLVFIHGWSCDSRYWNRQIPYFAKKYRVITIDLAGHGNSGFGREIYTMQAFGQDVAAVLDAVDARNAILAGHSMGGGVILHAAKIAPERIIGLIGVDTLQDMSRQLTEEEKKGFYDPLAADFEINTAHFVRSMFVEGTDPKLVDTVANDMSAAPPEVALSALREYIKMEPQDFVRDLKIPLKCVNADLWETSVERNKKLVPSFELGLMKGYGHFIMLEAPEKFNRLLDQMVGQILRE